MDNPSLILRENDEEDTISQGLDAPGAGDADQSNKNNNSNGGNRLMETDGKDQIAEPLYGLMGEIYDMRGLFNISSSTFLCQTWTRLHMLVFKFVFNFRCVQVFEAQFNHICTNYIR